MAAAVSPTRHGVFGMTRTRRTLSPAAACTHGGGKRRPGSVVSR